MIALQASQKPEKKKKKKTKRKKKQNLQTGKDCGIIKTVNP